MRPLYKINIDLEGAMRTAELEAEENQGEISDYLSSLLDSFEDEKDLKVGNICRYIKSLKAEGDMVRAEEKSLYDRRRVAENKAESLKQYLAGFLKEGETFADENSKILWRKSESVFITDAERVPPEYQKISITPDKAALKKAIKDGKEFDGISILPKQNIQIK
jgi:hypothetical protein